MMQDLNAAQLHRLLHIPNPRDETIFGVVGRMEVLIDLFTQHPKYHVFLPFLKTYYFVTKNAAEKYLKKKHFFYNLKDYEELDVYFASLYFKPLSAYLIEGKKESPWNTYFNYCLRSDSLPFLRMLLGVNAHINGDLAKALIDLKYRHEGDFFLVNDVLQEVVPQITKYMVFTEHDLLSTSGLVIKDFFLTEFHLLIEKWRSEAWISATFPKSKLTSSILAQKTERLGKELINDFERGSAIHFLEGTLHMRHAEGTN
jgi:hypothetical protein